MIKSSILFFNLLFDPDAEPVVAELAEPPLESTVDCLLLLDDDDVDDDVPDPDLFDDFPSE